MSKKRAIVTYEKLSEEMRDRLEEAFPEGFGGAMTQISTPTGELMDAVIWETDEIIYLVKLNKVKQKNVVIPEDDEEEEDFDDIPEDDVKGEDDDVADDEEEEEDFDVADEESEEDED
jgi:DNA-directed RNA polymerase subunit delta